MKVTPFPLFDTVEFIKSQSLPKVCQFSFATEDFNFTKAFLLSYKNNDATFNAYRREVERLLQWTWLIAKKSVRELKRTEIEAYIEFCQNPPLEWIGIKKVPRFNDKNGERVSNPEWRPFVATISKSAHREGKQPDRKAYTLSPKAIREIFTVTSSFYNFLIQENYANVNPILHVRQKNRYFRKTQTKTQIRRLSELQWQYVIESAESMAKQGPEQHERTLFIITALYAMYLRISELAASDRWTPKMRDFYCDHDGLWWFITVGKGNKERHISVSDAMLAALKRWRHYLGLSPLPSPADISPLIPKLAGKGPMSATSHLRKIVQRCFDVTIEKLKKEGFHEDADVLSQVTVHWLRHTGISDDVKRRPREHVRDDAGHSSSAITDKYIDIELRERHASAKKKPIKLLDEV